VVKSNPVPDSGTVASAVKTLDAIVSAPVCGPEFIGTNATPTVQLAPAAREVPHELAVNLNPALAARDRFSSETAELVFETVTVLGMLVAPTPVMGKLNWAGCNCTAPVSPPVPVRATVVGVGTELD
jgi:hypothetical protein